jgi:hypothetical protein
MAMTATERSRVLRERRASGKIVLTVVVLRTSSARSPGPVTPRREAAVSLFLSDMAWGLVQ